MTTYLYVRAFYWAVGKVKRAIGAASLKKDG
jgi:hypothetical protein